MGNQLIQLAYAESLARRAGVELTVNPLLLGRAWALLRRNTYRRRSLLSEGSGRECQGLQTQLIHFFRLKVAMVRRQALLETCSDAGCLELLRSPKQRTRYLFGYFQRAEVFGLEARPFWLRLATRLKAAEPLAPYPADQVVVHVRLGDYLLPENQRLFAALDLEDQILQALAWREQLNGRSPIHIITDDPKGFERLCPRDLRSEVHLIASGSAGADFRALIRHRRIVGSNSTFCLCAAQLAALLWQDNSTLLLPRRWYVDQEMNQQQQKALQGCRFTVSIS